MAVPPSPSNGGGDSAARPSGSGAGDMEDALAAGSVMAQAVKSARAMAEWAKAYPTLFSAKPIDETLFNSVACANSFGSPRLTADELSMANRTSLWYFGLDWIVDHLATSRAEVDDVARRCLAVAGGDSSAVDDELTAFLAEIRAELAASPTFSTLHEIWCDQLRRALTAMAREWSWKTRLRGEDGPTPTLADYLENADNYGSAWVNLSHWIAGGDQRVPAHIEALHRASREVQKVLRLLNDLVTYERDVSWGDLNALMLGVDRDSVTRQIALVVDNCHELIRPIRAVFPEQAEYLERQIGFSTGFYELSDYWGAL
jgi:terpene synthase-like protein